MHSAQSVTGLEGSLSKGALRWHDEAQKEAAEASGSGKAAAHIDNALPLHSSAATSAMAPNVLVTSVDSAVPLAQLSPADGAVQAGDSTAPAEPLGAADPHMDKLVTALVRTSDIESAAPRSTSPAATSERHSESAASLGVTANAAGGVGLGTVKAHRVADLLERIYQHKDEQRAAEHEEKQLAAVEQQTGGEVIELAAPVSIPADAKPVTAGSASLSTSQSSSDNAAAHVVVLQDGTVKPVRIRRFRVPLATRMRRTFELISVHSNRYLVQMEQKQHQPSILITQL